MKMLKELKWEAILTGVLYILLGIVALVIPETMQKTLGYLIGIVLIVAGLVSIICYLLRDARENYYHNEFVFGILGIVLGAVVLYKVEIVISLIPFILGVLVLCSGCSKLQDAIDLKRLGYGRGGGVLFLGNVPQHHSRSGTDLQSVQSSDSVVPCSGSGTDPQWCRRLLFYDLFCAQAPEIQTGAGCLGQYLRRGRP